MSSTVGGGGSAGSGGGVNGALSLMGCVREASPPPRDPLGVVELSTHQVDVAPKEPKKRRFHPLRGLRRIFRRKSRGAADSRLSPGIGDQDGDLVNRNRENITLRHPAGRPEEARSRSASELLTDSCDRDSKPPTGWQRKYRIASTSLKTRQSFKHIFLRRSGVEESFAKLRGGTAQLSVSHDSVFPGEVAHSRPLSSLDTLATLERRQGKSGDSVHVDKETTPRVVHRHRISLRVLEQIKTVIENRNQLATSTSGLETSIVHNRFAGFDKHERVHEETQVKVTKSPKDAGEKSVQSPKEDLPQLEIASLNHTAALHRISVRPKNRRPPRRTAPQSSPASVVPSVATISEASDTLDSLEPMSSTGSCADSPMESKPVSLLRKSSSRLSRTSEIFEELEAKLPRKPPSVTSLSPDSLDTPATKSCEVPEHVESVEVRQISRRPSNRISKGSDVFEELEAKLPWRRSSSNRISKSPESLENSRYSKSTEGFEKLVEDEEAKPVVKRLLNPISKSTDRVFESSDSLEVAVEEHQVERRRSSFELRGRRSAKSISKSIESFEALEAESELQKRSSASDVNLARGRRYSRSVSKSSDSFERMESIEAAPEPAIGSSTDPPGSRSCWRPAKRAAASSESSDNLEAEDELENRKVRRPPKRVPSTSVVDVVPSESLDDERRSSTPPGKPPRLQKSSESSELGSTDTIDSEKPNKLSDSTETLDSLEKDLEQDRKEEEITDNVVERREKSDAWAAKTAETATVDNSEEAKPLISDKNYWRRSSDTKENIDIHQLLAITIVTRMADNGNQRNSVIFPKKKLSSPPTSPVKQEDNKMLFNNLLASKNDEDLQNMLNGNISEVSTDTKSFKEKLIMFEKLGK
ncbi:dentin sialophosphoprotein isoform X2 [Orussus abietinus]|uniref:dentin sialophosphoprotein isoform X2 n=1 Tax=Orussus abietinus TaxID=222816 RepID=UPI00062646BB|nr:dentin sialophosphoprotein isoform X2 [Orussus abietinus]